GMGWLALSLPAHVQQAWGRNAPARLLRLHRALGAAAVALALVLCLGADHASIAVLVWAMTLSGAAFAAAFALAWRPCWLRALAPWRGGRRRGRGRASCPRGQAADVALPGRQHHRHVGECAQETHSGRSPRATRATHVAARTLSVGRHPPDARNDTPAGS